MTVRFKKGSETAMLRRHDLVHQEDSIWKRRRHCCGGYYGLVRYIATEPATSDCFHDDGDCNDCGHNELLGILLLRCRGRV